MPLRGYPHSSKKINLAPFFFLETLMQEIYPLFFAAGTGRMAGYGANGLEEGDAEKG